MKPGWRHAPRAAAKNSSNSSARLLLTPQRRVSSVLKKPASGVLAYGTGKHLFRQAMERAGKSRSRFALKTLGAHQLVPVRRHDAHYSSRRGPRCCLACGMTRLGAPGWAGENDGFFEHSAELG